MRKRKKAAADEAATDHEDSGGNDAPVKSHASGIGRYILIAVLAAAVLMGGAGAGLGWLQFIKQKELGEVALAGEMARQSATLIDTVVRQSEALADHLVSSQVVVDGFRTGATESAAARVSGVLLDGDVVLIPNDSLQAASNLSFSARDLILKARRGDELVPVFLPGEPPTLLIARALEDGSVLLLRQSLRVVYGLIRDQDLAGGWLTVKSKDGQLLFSAGAQVRGQSGVAPGLAGISATAVVPPGKEDPGLLMLYLLIAGGMMALVVLVIISTLLAIGRGMKKDAALLANLASDLTQHGQASTRAGFTFSTLELVTGSIRRLAEEGGHAASSPARRRVDDDDDDDGFMAVDDMASDEMADLASGDQDDAATVVNSAFSTGSDAPEEIFREYDVRGTAGKTLTAEVAQLIGRAVGSECLQGGSQVVLVARDGRLSSPDLAQSLIEGLLASGRDVIDLGAAPTPVLYYGIKALGCNSAIMVTGSHNPPEYNGFKIVVAGETIHGPRVRGLRERILRNDFSSGEGKLTQRDITSEYLAEVSGDIVMARPMKVVLDMANGIAGTVAPALFRQLGCDVTPLFEEVDGTFPNHHPDTSKPENYSALIDAVKTGGAEIGIAFDGDADRLGVVTPAGEIIWSDRLMMLFARDLLTRSPGADVLFDVKCSGELARLIKEHGGRPVMSPTGHSLIKAKMRETGAKLAGEMSGHIFFADRWSGYDDGFYAAARLLEILSLEAASVDEVFASLKTGMATPEITIAAPDSVKFDLIEKLKGMKTQFDGAVNTMDGLRVDFDDGWGLVRASNTTPSLVARFEGASEAALERIKSQFRAALSQIDGNLQLPF